MNKHATQIRTIVQSRKQKQILFQLFSNLSFVQRVWSRHKSVTVDRFEFITNLRSSIHSMTRYTAVIAGIGFEIQCIRPSAAVITPTNRKYRSRNSPVIEYA